MSVELPEEFAQLSGLEKVMALAQMVVKHEVMWQQHIAQRTRANAPEGLTGDGTALDVGIHQSIARFKIYIESESK